MSKQSVNRIGIKCTVKEKQRQSDGKYLITLNGEVMLLEGKLYELTIPDDTTSLVAMINMLPVHQLDNIELTIK